ncbi:hypothetical protein OBP_251 [Pseudomonas phage OBP]|uniref:hypothetical protein n=1 Tax=Pseudomonas phage OBP TaxID=1124849 RepID=UPI000240D5DF|nr:hypothetical protein OBP_251 [Pseudomonas phage OBP]AEV89688.1 hypothetical protein OBP_251 [Pseudomonas phage OBP]
MKISHKLRVLILLLGLGVTFVVLGKTIKRHYTDAQLMQHCINVNKGDILPYPEGCMKPIRIKNDIFEFINVNGQKEMYVVIKMRDSTFRYAKVRNS